MLSVVLSVLMTTLIVTGCRHSEPYLIGFIGPTSGRSADLGISGRNGAILAFEQVNAEGGIHGRDIKLIVRDDEQSAQRGREIIREFQRMNVDAVLGPFTSSVAVAIMPIVDEAQLTTIAVTTTSNLLSGKDDYLLRTVSSTSDHATRHGAYHYQQLGFRQVHVITDETNAAYTHSWYDDYSHGFTLAGGLAPDKTGFATGNDVDFDALVATVIATNPDLIILCTNSVDAAALAKAIRLAGSDVQIATSEWAGTERLISLGGHYVEGLIVPQYLNRQDPGAAYQAFRQAYLDRFNQQEPGFSGKIAYNSARVLAVALAEQKRGETLKDTIIRLRRFPGIQGDIQFTSTGDSRSETFISRIVDGEFISEAALQ